MRTRTRVHCTCPRGRWSTQCPVETHREWAMILGDDTEIPRKRARFDVAKAAVWVAAILFCLSVWANCFFVIRTRALKAEARLAHADAVAAEADAVNWATIASHYIRAEQQARNWTPGKPLPALDGLEAPSE